MLIMSRHTPLLECSWGCPGPPPARFNHRGEPPTPTNRGFQNRENNRPLSKRATPCSLLAPSVLLGTQTLGPRVRPGRREIQLSCCGL